jgi:DNA-binding transcriptional LysR family regulator
LAFDTSAVAASDVDLALAGFGMVIQPDVLLVEDVTAGRLVEILKDFWPTPLPMHLVYPRDRQAVPKLTTFVEFMLARFGSP